MPKYNDEFKAQAVRKMMPPNAMSVAQVSRDTGVSEVAPYNWRNQVLADEPMVSIGRYTLIKAVPTPGQVDVLSALTSIHFSSGVSTVGEAGIPYRICRKACRHCVHLAFVHQDNEWSRQQSNGHRQKAL